MFRLDRIYRTNYAGENVTTQAVLSRSAWTYQTEWIPSRVVNTQTSRVATVIGNGNSRKSFETHLVINHLAGRLGANTMQTYGCNALYREESPTFMVATGNQIIEEIASSGYCDDHIVYANADKLIKYPGKFYLIPQDITADAGTIATYLACFDGHEKVYLLGFDGWAGDGYNGNVYADTPGYDPVNFHIAEDFWVQNLTNIMSTYSEVEFVRCMPTPNWRIPVAWRSLPNFRQISYGQFALEADL